MSSRLLRFLSRRVRRFLQKNPCYPSDFRGFLFGNQLLPVGEELLHFLIMGTTGSGKTSVLSLLLLQFLGLIGKGLGHRMVMFDPKNNWARWLYTLLHPQAKLWFGNPFDVRSFRWRIAKDIHSPAHVLQLADTLIPINRSASQPFFDMASRDILAGLITALTHLSSDRWSLRHVILAAGNSERLKAILRSCPVTRELPRQYLSARSGRDVLSTLRTHLAGFSAVAAAWEHATCEFTLGDFFADEGVLLLGYDDASTAALQSLNRLLLKRLCEETLRFQQPKHHVWMAFDEFALFGKAEGLQSIALRGRSSNASLIVCAQDINGLDALYGREANRDMLANLHQCCFLKTMSEESAKFASDTLGQQEVLQRNWSYTSGSSEGKGSNSTTCAESIAIRQNVLTTELRDLVAPSPSNDRIEAFFRTSHLGSYYSAFRFQQTLNAVQLPTEFENHEPRNSKELHLKPWDKSDWAFLQLAPPKRGI
jgi:type IV secretory pathway TraG/TraD family ATPase VirD4